MHIIFESILHLTAKNYQTFYVSWSSGAPKLSEFFWRIQIIRSPKTVHAFSV